MAGAIVGLLAGVLFSIYVLTANFTSVSGESVTDAIRMQNVAYSLIVSPVAGLVMGAIGGFIQRMVRVVAA